MSISTKTYQKSIKALNRVAKQEELEIEEFTKYIPYELRKNNDLIEVIKQGSDNKIDSKDN